MVFITGNYCTPTLNKDDDYNNNDNTNILHVLVLGVDQRHDIKVTNEYFNALHFQWFHNHITHSKTRSEKLLKCTI